MVGGGFWWLGWSQGRRGSREERGRSKGEVLGAEGGDAGGCEVVDLCADFETYHSIIGIIVSSGGINK